MKLTKNQIQQQREAIDDLYELVKEAPASERKDSAMAYCEGCIAACDLGLKVLNGKKTEDTPKAEENTTVDEQAAIEEKPKRKRVAKKKDEPVEEALPIVDGTSEEEDDLDDLL